MNATMIKPPIKNNQQRAYKRSLNLHITLLVVSLGAVLTRAFIALPEGETWGPEAMFQTLLMLLLGAGVSVVIELFYSLSEGTSQEFATYRRWVDPVNSGLLIALLLPTTTPIYVLVLAVFIGVYVAKLAFGGYGYYIFHPALVGVLFVQVSFPGVYNDLSTPLMQLKAVFTEAATLNFNLTDLLIGNYQAIAIGSTSILLLAVALIYLLITRVIDYRISGTFLLVMVVLSLMIGYISFGANALAYTAINLMTGLTMFGAVFLVPESVSSPTSREAKLIYATVVALMTMLVRTVGGAFEGIVFAVLLGNLITPYLNRTVTRSNQSTLIKTGVALAVVTVIAGLVLGFLVQNQLADTYEPVAQWIGGWFA